MVAAVERGGPVRAISPGDQHVTGKNLKRLLKANVDPSATIMTDESGVYYGIGRHFAGGHHTVRHSTGEYVRGNAHTNTIECQFSLLKRGLIGTFHHVGQQHLRRYVAEFDFRWNYRVKLGYDDVDRVHVCLQNIMGKRLTYRRTHEARH